MLSINLDGAFYLCRLVLPGMRERRGGRIVNTCSLAMKSGGLTAGTAYAASKGALAALTFSLARETAAGGGHHRERDRPRLRAPTPMVEQQLTEQQRQAAPQADPGRPLLRA